MLLMDFLLNLLTYLSFFEKKQDIIPRNDKKSIFRKIIFRFFILQVLPCETIDFSILLRYNMKNNKKFLQKRGD